MTDENVIPFKPKRRRKGKMADPITVEERNLKLDHDPRPVVLEPKWAVQEDNKGKKQ